MRLSRIAAFRFFVQRPPPTFSPARWKTASTPRKASAGGGEAASQANGVTSGPSSARARAGSRVRTAGWSSWATRRRPMNPVAPVTNALMLSSAPGLELTRNGVSHDDDHGGRQRSAENRGRDHAGGRERRVLGTGRPQQDLALPLRAVHQQAVLRRRAQEVRLPVAVQGGRASAPGGADAPADGMKKSSEFCYVGLRPVLSKRRRAGCSGAVCYSITTTRAGSLNCSALLADHTELRAFRPRSEEHTSELQSQSNLVCRLLLEK